MSIHEEATAPRPGILHYQILCAFCLAVILLVQLQAGLVLTNYLCIGIGALGLLARLRAAPILLLALVTVAQLSLSRSAHFAYANRSMEPNDVLLCAAVLGYVACHYRLQSIWYGVLPTDARVREGAQRRGFPWIRRRAPLVHDKRQAGQISARELAWLAATLPVWAVLAQVTNMLIPQEWYLLGFAASFVRILVILWLLVIGFAVVRAFFGYGKQRDREPAAAQMYLQDILWRDTRGEQRRVNRWLAWWRLKRGGSE